MGTKWGHSVLGKLPDKPGLFIEWAEELKGIPLEPAVYYLYVDSLNEATGEITLLVRKFSSITGSLPHAAEGSHVYLREGIKGQEVSIVETEVEFDIGIHSIILKNIPLEPLQLQKGGILLEPLTDYWVLRDHDEVITTTTGGLERVYLPEGLVDWELYDSQTGYTLKSNIDFLKTPYGGISLSPLSPPGVELRVRGKLKADPTFPIHPENKFPFPSQGEIVPETVWFKTSGGSFGYSDLVQIGTDWYLKEPLLPGFRYRWSAKMDLGDQEVKVSKNSTDTSIIPGMVFGIGDKVEPGDEVAIIITDRRCETYEVYGSTESISFSIRVTANDRDTVADLASMLKEHLLIRSRDRHEASGLTIYEASMNTITEMRDGSGVHTNSTREISVQAAADWRYFSPLINQVSDIDISEVRTTTRVDFPGNMTLVPFGMAFGIKAWRGSTSTFYRDPSTIPTWTPPN
jgi:hypothetical protein